MRGHYPQTGVYVAAPSTIIRMAAALVLVAAWLVLHWYKPEWAMLLFKPWISARENFGWWVPAVGGGLLAALLANYLWTLHGGKYRRGDDAVGLGCVMFAAWGVGALLLVLGLAVVFGWYGVVNLISFLMMILTLLILPQYYWAKFVDWRKKRARAGP